MNASTAGTSSGLSVSSIIAAVAPPRIARKLSVASGSAAMAMADVVISNDSATHRYSAVAVSPRRPVKIGGIDQTTPSRMPSSKVWRMSFSRAE